MKTFEGAATKSQVENGGRIQHMVKGNAELNEGDASLLKEADGLLDESKEARERACVLEEDKEAMVAKLRSPRACYGLLTQEKA